MLLTENAVLGLIAFALTGLGFSCIVPTVFRAAARLPGHPPGPSIAAVSTLAYFGFLAGPAVIGLIAEATTLPTALGILVGLALMVSALASRTAPADWELITPDR